MFENFLFDWSFIMLSKPQYEEQIAASRDERMKWWREARFGMFIHS